MLKRVNILLVVSLLCLHPFAVYAADISGCVTKQSNGEPLVDVGIFLRDEYDINIYNHLGNVDSGTGCYSFTGLAEGYFTLKAMTGSPGPEQAYVEKNQSVEITSSGNIVDFALELGGNISGNLTTEVPIADPGGMPLYVIIFDLNGNKIAFGSVDLYNNGSYTSHGVPPGEYFVGFYDDDDQFQDEWYGNIPADFASTWAAPSVTVTLDETTINIDGELHELSEAHNRYYYRYVELSTWHQHRVAENITTTHILGYTEAHRASSGAPIAADDIETFTVSYPSGVCSDSEFETYAQWRWRVVDLDDDGGLGDGVIDRPDEELKLGDYFTVDQLCFYGTAQHEAGTYQFQTTFLNGGNNGSPLTASRTLPAGLTVAQLPPPTSLIAQWDDFTNELDLSWDMPTYDPGIVREVQVRVYSYKKGVALYKEFRASNLPPTLNSFTLNADMTSMFNHTGVDQIDIQVRVYGSNNTIARMRQSYNFDSTTGPLTPADIAAPPYDINDDGRTGLAETIHILKSLATP